MRSLTARLKDDYCSTIVANHKLITIIKFVSKSYTHPYKNFGNKLRLVLHALFVFFKKKFVASTKHGPTRRAGGAFPSVFVRRRGWQQPAAGARRSGRPARNSDDVGPQI